MDTFDPWSRPIVAFNGFHGIDPKLPEFSPAELVEFLSCFPDPLCTFGVCRGRDCAAKQHTLCWSPVTYAEGTKRGNANVLTINYAVFDLDHISAVDFRAAKNSLADYEYIIHTTHSHAPGDECYRVIMPLSSPVFAADWAKTYTSILERLKISVDVLPDPARIYARPTQRGGVPPLSEHNRGKTLDISVSETPKTKPPTSLKVYDLKELTDLVREAKNAKSRSVEKKAQAEILDRVVSGAKLADHGSRDKTLLSACGMIAYILPIDVPWEAVVEILRPSLSLMAEPEGVDHWIAEAKDMYSRALQAREKFEAQKEVERKYFAELAKSIADKSVVAGLKASDDALEGWQGLLIETKDGQIKGNELNAQLLLSCAPELRSTFRWNVLTRAVEITGGPFVHADPASLHVTVSAWLQMQYRFTGGANLVGQAIQQVARENKYDPIADYLRSLAWDGHERLSNFMTDYFAGQGDPLYVRAVGRKWLISLVARALHPGCKCDTALILEGPQGVRKSTALETLVGSEYFLDTALELGSKDAIQAISGAWLVELSELASFRRAETERVKQFISSKVDKFRPPYGMVIESSPRRCVFVGTTNENEYLYDPTGLRRYWPIRAEHPDVEAIARDRDQLFAEAVVAFLSGEKWHLIDREVEVAKIETENRVESSTIESVIRRWWYGESPSKRPKHFDMVDVLEMALHVTPDRMADRRLRIEVGIALARIGFESRRRREGRSLVTVYEAPLDLMNAQTQTTASRNAALSIVKSIQEKVSS
jgi:predicted P-loop ATPase